MEIGTELFSMALALRLQRSTQSPDYSGLKLIESPHSGAYNSNWDLLAVNRKARSKDGFLSNGLTDQLYFYHSFQTSKIPYNIQINVTQELDDNFTPEMELFYRHSTTWTVVYCVAYLIVFIVGLIGNSFVIAVVFRAPRMRTVTNFFIVNLALADILVIVFCLPATLMSNIFVRKYTDELF